MNSAYKTIYAKSTFVNYGVLPLSLALTLAASSAFAGPIQLLDHKSEVRVTLENLDKNIDDLNLAVGPVANAGAVLSYTSNSINQAQRIFDPFIRYEDQFGSNVGSYSASIYQSGSSYGFSYASDIVSVNAAGDRSPLVALDAAVDTSFRVTEDTKARINVALQGDTVAGRNFVGMQLDGFGDDGAFERLYYVPSRFGLSEVSASESLEVNLKNGFTYQLSGESNGSTLYSAKHNGPAPPSGLAYSVLTTQSLVGNSAENSLKPGASNFMGAQGTDFVHQFLLDSDEVLALQGAAVWLDPEVAVGFDYFIDGAGLLGIDLPGLSLFNNPTYQLFDLSGNFLADLLAGQSFNFQSAVNGFSLRGIDPHLTLDPFAPGFTIGLRFDTPDTSTILINQTPLTASNNVNSVPLPSMIYIWLIAGFYILSRSKHYSSS